MEITWKNYKIEINLNENGVLFFIRNKGKNISMPLQNNIEITNDLIDSDFINILYKLEEFWFLELIDDYNEGFLLTNENIFKIENEEKKSLRLPTDTIDEVKIKTSSFLTSKSFNIKTKVYKNNKPLPIFFKREGIFIIKRNEVYVLNEYQYKIINSIDNFNFNQSDIDDKIILLSKIKKIASLEKKITLDKYLMNNEYVTPEKYNVSIEENDDKIRILANYEDVDNEINKFINDQNVDQITNVGNKLQRKRIVFDNKNYEEYKKVKSIPEIRDDDIPKFIDQPFEYIPDDLDIDLTEFGERVKGLKTRVYKIHTFAGTKKSDNDWFVDFKYKLRDSLEDYETDITDNELEEIIEKYKGENKDYVKYKDNWIKIPNDIEENYEKIKEVKKNNKNIDYILEIFTNIDNLEYSEDIINKYKMLKKHGIEGVIQPSNFNAKLYDYQFIGYNWLLNQKSLNIGSLLADDMGLGKTIQVISYLGNQIQNDELSSTLLVVPASLIENWQNELKKFLDYDLNIYIYRGQGRVKDKKFIMKHEVVITTYGTLARDQVLLGKIQWKNIIIDEAQKIKNTTTYVTNAVKALKSDNKIALTGTPVENNLTELWSIIDFIQPGFLGSLKEFKEKYSKEIENDNYEILNHLTNRIKPVFLRRNKKDILKELPRKIEKKVEIGMTPIQKDLYKLIINKAKTDDHRYVLKYINQLIQLSSHSQLVKKHYEHSLNDIYEGSKKLSKTIDIIRNVESNGEKAIVFTGYKKMQEILRKAILKEFNIHVSIINGDVKTSRVQIVDVFNKSDGFNVIILSPRAAGVGLNVTGANHVIHYTREWNPAIENQATDRAYRIGQTKDVYVYYLISRLDDSHVSADMRIDALLEEKKKLFNNTIIPTKGLKVSISDFDDII